MDYRERWELKHYLLGQILEGRIRLFHAGLFLLLLVFLLNFWYLQGVRGEDYKNLAENNRLRRIPMTPTRGEIVDRHGEVIASTRPSIDLLLRREGVDDLELQMQLKRLAPILDVPYEELIERLGEMARTPRFTSMMLKEDATLEQLARIESRRERFPSVEVRESARRHYPEGQLFAHVLGFVGEVSQEQLADVEGLASGDIVGKDGVERSYDEIVRGRRGWKVVSVNNLGRQMGDGQVQLEPRHGARLELTLDLALQRTLVDALGPEVGAGVFIDPWNGEVLAMASTPTFDPNLFADGISRHDWEAISGNPERPMHDRAIASFHAPGSTFKVVMAVAGLESGTVTPDTTVYCTGQAEFYGRQRLCWKSGGHGTVNMRRALAESCNVYFYKLGRDLGIDEIHKYGQLFGLGRPTGIDLPGEEKGVLPSRTFKRERFREPWYPGDTISVAIGQGLLAATPIQMATALGVVATGGTLPQPHLVVGSAAAPRHVTISDGTLRVVRGALADAVRRGTAHRAGLDKISVAGKTGTAQVYAHTAGVDSDTLPKEEREHAWFVGYAPADKPRIVFAVVVEHGGHGGAAAAPVARQVLEVFFAADERDDTQAALATQAAGE